MMDFDSVVRSFPVGFHVLHPDVALNFQMNRFLHGADLMEVQSIAPRIVNLSDWKREYLALARAAESEGRIEAAIAYYRAAEFFIAHGDPDKRFSYERFRALIDPLIVEASGTRRGVPFGSGVLPCIEYPHQSPCDTIVLHSGFDGFQEDMFRIACAFQAAGYRVISFDGPGQGAALSEHGLTLTPEWHGPVAAVLDAYAISRCTILGMSLGGCLALRAASREPRIARVVVFGVMYDFFACFARAGGPKLGQLLRLALRAGADPLIERGMHRRMREDMLAAWGIPHGMHTLGVDRPAAMLREVARFTTRDCSKFVRQDVLLFGSSEDHYVPTRQLFDQARALENARSVTMRLLTRAEHAQNHCAVGNHPVVIRTIQHWLDERLDAEA